MAEALKLVPIIKSNFVPNDVFKAKDLGALVGCDLHSVKMKLRQIKMKETLGVMIFKVGNCKNKLWYYRKLSQGEGDLGLEPWFSGGMGQKGKTPIRPAKTKS